MRKAGLGAGALYAAPELAAGAACNYFRQQRVPVLLIQLKQLHMLLLTYGSSWQRRGSLGWGFWISHGEGL